MFTSAHEATTEPAGLACERCAGIVGTVRVSRPRVHPSLRVTRAADCAMCFTPDNVADLLLAPLPGTDVTAAGAAWTEDVGSVVVLEQTDRDWLTPDSGATGRVA